MEVNYLFIAIVALIVYMTVRGYRKGFLRIVVSFIGMVAIIILAKKAAPFVTDYLYNNTGAYEKIVLGIEEMFREANEQYDNSIPENQIKTIDSYNVPDSLKNSLIVNNTTQMYKTLVVDLFEDYVSAYLANTAIKAAGFVLAFIVLIIAFKVLLSVVDIISRIPIIRGINQFIGGCLGFIESLIITWVFFFATVIFVGNKSGSVIFKMIADSDFLTLLFNTNLLLDIIS